MELLGISLFSQDFVSGVLVGVVLSELVRLATRDIYSTIKSATKEKAVHHWNRWNMSDYEKQIDDLFGDEEDLYIHDTISEGDNYTNRIEAEAGQTINCYLSNDTGHVSTAKLLDSDGEECLSIRSEVEEFDSYTVENTECYRINVILDGTATLKVNVT